MLDGADHALSSDDPTGNTPPLYGTPLYAIYLVEVLSGSGTRLITPLPGSYTIGIQWKQNTAIVRIKRSPSAEVRPCVWLAAVLSPPAVKFVERVSGMLRAHLTD